MPRGRRRTQTVCIESGCARSAAYRGRCAAHRLRPAGTGERGSTWRGRKTRERVLNKAKDGNGIPRCFYCNAPATIADHYMPLALGGGDTERNQVAACVPCNREKSDRDPTEFMASSWLARRCAEVASRVAA